MRQTMLVSYSAEELLSKPIAFDNHLLDVVENYVSHNGVSHTKTALIEVTARRCLARVQYGSDGKFTCRSCIDILVVEVPPKIRRRGIFKKFIFILEQQPGLIRFHNVQNLAMQDFLIKRGYLLEGEYWTCEGGAL